VGVDLVTPDFAALAEAAGVRSAAVTGTDGFADTLAKALSEGRPWLIDVDVREMAPMELRPQRRPV
jgi:acetolactate synthase-1/2/3 large subunit